MFFSTPEEGINTSKYSSYPEIGIGTSLARFLNTVKEEDRVYMAFYSNIEPEVIREAITNATTTTGGELYYIMHKDYTPPRQVFEFENIYNYLESSNRLIVSTENALMHNKFAVVINTTAETGRVWTGSYNPNHSGIHPHNENVVWIESFELAEAYASEFLNMWNEGNGSFSTDKSTHTYTYRKVDVEGTKVEVFFSPYDRIPTETVSSMIREAEKSVLFNKFFFSVNFSDIIQSLKYAYDGGVTVKGVIHETLALHNELREYGIDVVFHGTPIGYMHHKFSIIDAGTQDAVTITGSPNWTLQGYGQHDENFLIIHCADITDRYYREFMKNYSLAVGGDPIVRGKEAVSNTRAWPSPVRGHEGDDRVNIVYELSVGVQEVSVHIYTISGRLVKSIKSDEVLPGAENEVSWIFDSSSPAPGLYIAAVEVETGDGTFYDTTKFAIIR